MNHQLVKVRTPPKRSWKTILYKESIYLIIYQPFHGIWETFIGRTYPKIFASFNEESVHTVKHWLPAGPGLLLWTNTISRIVFRILLWTVLLHRKEDPVGDIRRKINLSYGSRAIKNPFLHHWAMLNKIMSDVCVSFIF